MGQRLGVIRLMGAVRVRRIFEDLAKDQLLRSCGDDGALSRCRYGDAQRVWWLSIARRFSADDCGGCPIRRE